jgi:hypothetical protein
LPKLTPRDAALAELTNKGMPAPSEFMPDFDLPPALFILREVVQGAMESAVIFFGKMAESGDEVSDTAAEVFNAIAQCMAGATHALVALEMLPQAAEDAMMEAAG